MSSARSVLLLNPPGRDVYIRDYYCSKTSRSDYTFPPIDLLHVGGKFRERGWEAAAIDAIVENLSIEETLHRIAAAKPDAIFTLAGAVSAEEDADFLKLLRSAAPHAVLIGSGDILIEHGRKWVETGLLDAVCLDFGSVSPVRFAEGMRDGLTDLIFRQDGEVKDGGKAPERTVSTGIPVHDLFLPFAYHFPFARHRPFASILTDYGCPFRCSFCVMAGLHYHRRPMEDVAAELENLKSAGVREFVIWDQTFAADRKRGLQFLDLLAEGKDRFGWTCLIRPDRIDRELARRMAAKGCHTVIMGVETANEESLKAIKKDFTLDQVRDAFAFCHEEGLETVATVIIGLPGETEKDVVATMDFICDIDPDYLSVHTAVPRSGTELRAEMVEAGLIAGDMDMMDQSGVRIAISSNAMDAETILALRKTFNRRFHLRPRYLARMFFRRLLQPRLFVEQLRQGLRLLARNV